MRVIALEEHFSIPALVKRIDPAVVSRRGFKPRKQVPGKPGLNELLAEIGEVRLKSMDETGVTMQVLSPGGPGPDLVPGPDGVAFARETNDQVATAIAKHPTRFAAFATLPMASPDACAAELRRCVKDLRFPGALINGTTDGRFLDHPSYDSLLAAAVELDVPIYIHPHLPPPAVHEIYYSGLPDGADRVLATAGWGWHSEVAIQVLRMALAGTLDKHPKLKIIIGHMGEGLPFSLWRVDYTLRRAGNAPIDFRDLFTEHFWITTSGNFSTPALICSMLEMGSDHIMYSVDYPFVDNPPGTEWMRDVQISAEDKGKILSGNAKRLLKL